MNGPGEPTHGNAHAPGTVHVSFDRERGMPVIDLANSTEQDRWLNNEPPERYRKTASVRAFVAVEGGVAETPEGVMTFEAGDYLVTDDPPTHVWPVRKAYFESTHEPVGGKP